MYSDNGEIRFSNFDNWLIFCSIQDGFENSTKKENMNNNDVNNAEPSAVELAAEELELAKANFVPIDHGETPERTLISQADYAAAHSKDEREKKILGNIRLVYHFAKKYYVDGAISREDLIQEGIAGLTKAIDRYDPAKGNKLSTYACWWIRQAIGRAMDEQSKEIRVPVHMVQKQRKIRKAVISLEGKLGRRPSLEEIMQETGYSIEAIAYAFEKSGMITCSIDAPIELGNGDSAMISERIADTLIPRPDQALIDKEEGVDPKKLAILEKLKTLTSVSERKKQVFKHFHSLNGSVVIHQTLESTAHYFGVTRERIRQINRDIRDRLKLNQEESEGHVTSGKSPARLKMADRMGLTHIRASPAFINWKPVKKVSDPAATVIDFLSAAYELRNKDILSNKRREDILWARALAVIMMIEDIGMTPKEIKHRFSFFNESTDKMVFEIRLVVDKDSVVRKDVETMRSHFKSVMKIK
jgi:RNA polymerase primary sigma factor